MPLLVPQAPSATLLERFVPALATLLLAHGSSPALVRAEAEDMSEWRLTETTSRSIVGIMDEFTSLAGPHGPIEGAGPVRTVIALGQDAVRPPRFVVFDPCQKAC